MTQKSRVERRQHPRVANHVPVKISSPGADFVTETKNISCSGAYCRIDQYLEPMTRLGITFLLPIRKDGKVTTKRLSCNGVVVRTENIPNEKEFYIAVFFNDIHPRDTRTLADFVASIQTEQKKS